MKVAYAMAVAIPLLTMWTIVWAERQHAAHRHVVVCVYSATEPVMCQKAERVK